MILVAFMRITFIGVIIIACLAFVLLRWLADGKVGKTLLVVGGLFFFMILTYHSAEVEIPAQVETQPAALASISATSKIKEHHDPAIEALWEQLTAGRIDLEQSQSSSGTIAVDASEDAESPEVSTEADLEIIRDHEMTDRLKPDWVINEPKMMGNVYRQRVSSGPWDTVEATHLELEEHQLPDAICSRIEALVAPSVGHDVDVDSLLPLGIGLDFIFREVCRDEYTETIDGLSVGPMKKTYVLLEFDAGVDRQLREAWYRYQRGHHLGVFAEIAGGILLCISAAYGLLRFDTWTKGYYSRELLWGAVAAIIAVGFFAFS